MIDTTTHVLPDFCDLRPLVDEVEEQGNAGTCVSNTGVKLAEVLSERSRDKFPGMGFAPKNFSRLWLNYWMHLLEVRIGEQGASPESLWKVMQNFGLCSEESWPYDLTKQDVQPPYSCHLEAQQFKVREYTSLTAGTGAGDWLLAKGRTISNVKHALAQGRPVALSFNVTQDFIDQGSNQHEWRSFTWNPKPSVSNPSAGGHAVLAIGYSADRILCQNSWGPTWGDGGFFGMPYEMFGDLFQGVNSAYCSIYDSIGHIPVDNYTKIIYDSAEQDAIKQVVDAQLAPLTIKSKEYGIPGARIDAAMGWSAGLAERVLNL